MLLFCFYNGILGNEGNHSNHFLQYSRSGKTDFGFMDIFYSHSDSHV